MSKRFGRNQKRKLRQQIDNAERRASEARDRISEISMLAERNRTIVKMTAAILGNHFLSLPPKTIKIKTLEELPKYWKVTYGGGAVGRRLYSEGRQITDACLLEKMLPVIHGTVFQEVFRKMTHFAFKYDGETVGYAISEEQMLTLPEEVIVSNVSSAVTEMLVTMFRNTHEQERVAQ